jgi:hypothetical protein
MQALWKWKRLRKKIRYNTDLIAISNFYFKQFFMSWKFNTIQEKYFLTVGCDICSTISFTKMNFSLHYSVFSAFVS